MSLIQPVEGVNRTKSLSKGEFTLPDSLPDRNQSSLALGLRLRLKHIPRVLWFSGLQTCTGTIPLAFPVSSLPTEVDYTHTHTHSFPLFPWSLKSTLPLHQQDSYQGCQCPSCCHIPQSILKPYLSQCTSSTCHNQSHPPS